MESLVVTAGFTTEHFPCVQNATEPCSTESTEDSCNRSLAAAIYASSDLPDELTPMSLDLLRYMKFPIGDVVSRAFGLGRSSVEIGPMTVAAVCRAGNPDGWPHLLVDGVQMYGTQVFSPNLTLGWPSAVPCNMQNALMRDKKVTGLYYRDTDTTATLADGTNVTSCVIIAFLHNPF